MRSSDSTTSMTSLGVRESDYCEKRPREEDETDTESDSHKKPRTTLPSGLLNFASACFSNAAVQLLASALTPAQISQLVGDGVEYVLGLGEPPLGKLQGKKLSKALEDVGQTIAGTPPSKLSPYLGKVLEELHEHHGMAVDPIEFQQIFACGSEGKSRQTFRGDTQQDASEYLRDLISAVSGEHGVLDEAFQYKTAEAIICTAPDCGYRNECSEESAHLLEVKMPYSPTERSRREKSDRPLTTLSALIEHQLDSEMLEGATCEKCKSKDTLTRQTAMTKLPDNLIVSINRAKFDHPTWGGSRIAGGSAASPAKDTNKVEVNLENIRVGEQGVYRMVAMVKHEGRQANNGHYTAYRKVEDGKWAYLDDQFVKLVPERSLDDGVKGFSSILLLQRQPQRPSSTSLLQILGS